LQTTGAKATTVRNQAEREGAALAAAKTAKAEAAFEACGFEADGYKKPETVIDFSRAIRQTTDIGSVTEAAQELGINAYAAQEPGTNAYAAQEPGTNAYAAQEPGTNADVSDYEDANSAVNISVDEVCCKHQTDRRPCSDPEKEPKQVRNTVIHVQHRDRGYILTGETVAAAIRLLMGFLLANNLLGAYPIVFFSDGAKNIKNAVEEYFSFAPYRYILDWPHLCKKSSEFLSSSIKGMNKRNEVHAMVKRHLWRGDVAGAISYLDALPAEYVKSADWLVKLKDFLDRNRVNIPCYAMRKKLKLRISSNIGEKANDRVVSSRQKHNGMAWSKEGSIGLAGLCAAHINGEMTDWLHGQSIRFAFDDTKIA